MSHTSIGWLLILKMGLLHRDINIGNVLMLDPPVTKPFGAWTIEQLMTQLHLQNRDELAKHVSLLENMVGGLGSPGKCYGFVMGGDMAACLESYSMLHGTGERSVGVSNCVGEPN